MRKFIVLLGALIASGCGPFLDASPDYQLSVRKAEAFIKYLQTENALIGFSYADLKRIEDKLSAEIRDSILESRNRK